MYRLYIDETGNHDINVPADSLHRYLSLTGVIINESYARTKMTSYLNDLKSKHFGHWQKQPVIFHRKEIMNKRGPFEILKDKTKEQAFNEDFLSVLMQSKFRIISVLIDKYEHKEKYKVWQANPYHYCMEVLVEKYVLWLERNGTTGDVVAEARTPQLDRKLKKAFRYHYRNGTRYAPQPKVQGHLTSKKLKFYPKYRNIAGLQIADLVAHPSAAYIRSVKNGTPAPRNFGYRVCQILRKNKYDRSPWVGKIKGYGIKWLP